jgi:hypothetical protein
MKVSGLRVKLKGWRAVIGRNRLRRTGKGKATTNAKDAKASAKVAEEGSSGCGTI